MLISIITINYNNIKGLKTTIRSVIDQSYENIEFIIIDGNSNDGSKEVIKKYKNFINYSICEPDNGPYDAMNKGIDRAVGDYLLFLNSGDYLANNLVLEKYLKFNPVEDIVYGDSMIKEGNRFKRIKMPKTLTIGIALTHTINHQTIFYKKTLFDDGSRYDCSYKIVADWVFTNKAVINKNCSTRHINLIISVYDTDGISSDKRLRVEDRKRYFESFDDKFIELRNDYALLNAQHRLLTNNYFIKLMLKVYKTYNNLKGNI